MGISNKTFCYTEYYLEAIYSDCTPAHSDTVGDTLHCYVGQKEYNGFSPEIFPNPADNQVIIQSEVII